MKAVLIKQYGGHEVIEIVDDWVVPAPAPDQVTVTVKAVSLNRIDSMLRLGYMHKMMPLTFPAVLAGDLAGIVTAVGAGVVNVAVGDEV